MAEARSGGTAAHLKDALLGSPATERLKEEAAAFAAAQAQRLLVAGGRKLGAATTKLQDVADGDSPGVGRLLLEGGRRVAGGEGPLRAAVGAGASEAKGRVRQALGRLGGGGRSGGGAGRFVTVVEDIDVGVPVRTAYDQWTQFQEFSAFTKGVQGVDRTDEVTSNWRAKVFWSNRSWQAKIGEQLPDRRITWSAEGPKATLKGAVTFHELAPELTRVLLVIEYYPKGLFEKTGNLWRAQGRRARLDLKHFRRFVMMRGEATGSWRGEIHDGEVVESHEDAVGREEEEQEGAAAGNGAESGPEDAYEDDDAYEDEAAEDEALDDEDEFVEEDGPEGYEDEEEEAEEEDEAGLDEAEPEDSDAYEDAPRYEPERAR